MKKLLGISLVAVLAASPMMAKAEDFVPTIVGGEPAEKPNTQTVAQVTTENDPEFALVMSAETDGNAASAGYVKGAYNAAIKAINKVNANTKTNAGDGLTKNGNTISVDLDSVKGLDVFGETEGSKKLGVKIEANKGLTVGANGIAVVAGNGTEVDSTGVKVVAEANKGIAVSGNGVAVVTGNGIGVDGSGVKVVAEANEGLTVGANGVAVDYDNSTIGIVNNKLAIKNGVQGTETNGYSADTALTTKGYVDEAIDGLATDYATIEGVDNTIDALSATTTIATNATLTNGAVTGTGTVAIMTDWSNPNTATTLAVNPGTMAVNPAISQATYNTTIIKTAYASAQSSGED